MEIFAGCKTLQKRKGFETALKFYGRASFTDSVSGKAISLIKRYTVRDVTLHIPDMLFAATAINYNLPLKTLNVKDFDFNRELELI